MSLPHFKFAELFAGIGGFRCALEPLGGRCVFASEIDPKSRRMYEANFKDYPDGDITEIDAAAIPDHDILTAGFPCQSFSTNGNGQQGGFNDDRGQLFFHIVRILKEKRPAAFILENVPGLLYHESGATMNRILHELTDAGYYTSYDILRGMDYGVPQKRNRVIFVGFRAPVLFSWPSKKQQRGKLADIFEPDADVPQDMWLPHNSMSAKVRNDVQTWIAQTEAKTPAAILDEPYMVNIMQCGRGFAQHYSWTLLNQPVNKRYRIVNGRRYLTGRERMRLMGFPDTYQIISSYADICSQTGNALIVPKIQSVAGAVLEYL